VAVNITSVGASIKIEITTHTDGYPAETYYLNKTECDVKAQANYIYIGIRSRINKIFKFRYTSVTLPLSADVEDLASKINAMLTNNVVQYAGINVLMQFSDFKTEIFYLDQGTADERIDYVVYSSVLSGLPSITATMSYVGGPSTYALSVIQYS
jgi:hypothetical protein